MVGSNLPSTPLVIDVVPLANMAGQRFFAIAPSVHEKANGRLR